MGIGKIIADISRDKDDMKRSFGAAGSLTNFVNLHPQTLKLTAPYTIESTRTLGSSFIVGHSGLGWIGYNVASVAVGSQPFIGDSRGAWTALRIVSPNNTFVETFDGSRFKDPSTTADWSTGSCVFTSGEKLLTETIYLGSNTLSNIRLTIEGSTYSNLQIEATPDGTNWEIASSGSAETYTFTNSGSSLKLRFTEINGNEAILTKYEAKYGLR